MTTLDDLPKTLQKHMGRRTKIRQTETETTKSSTVNKPLITYKSNTVQVQRNFMNAGNDESSHVPAPGFADALRIVEAITA